MIETPKDEPATKEDVEKLRQEMYRSLEGHRQQQSAEHGSIMAKLTYVTEISIWLKTRWEKFSRGGTTWHGDSK